MLQDFWYALRALVKQPSFAAGTILAGVVFLACYLPARRAANVDPVVVLRC